MRTKTSYPGIIRVGRNQYEVRVRATDPKTGKRQDKKRIWKGTVHGALDLQKQLSAVLKSGASQTRTTLGAYARSWLEQVSQRVRPSTAKTYANQLGHILDALGHCYLDALKPGDIETFQTVQMGKGVSGNTIRSQLNLLRQIARHAQIHEVIQRDFCLGVRLRATLHEYTEDEPNCLSADELARLAEVIPATWYPIFATMAFTGIRWGEVSGLRWEDVDDESGILYIRRTNNRGVLGEPKTRKSRRLVPMTPELAGILRAHRARMEQVQHPGLAAGWVFPSRKGGLYQCYPMNKVLAQSIRAAGIKKHLSQHGLRRTFNDLLTRVVSGRVARGILGHSTVQMTDHYSFVDRSEKRAAQAAVLQLVHAESEAGKRGEECGEALPQGQAA